MDEKTTTFAKYYNDTSLNNITMYLLPVMQITTDNNFGTRNQKNNDYKNW